MKFNARLNGLLVQGSSCDARKEGVDPTTLHKKVSLSLSELFVLSFLRAPFLQQSEINPPAASQTEENVGKPDCNF
jgi:hypothetical protein